jgi:SAM-dependent methyltransferase
VAGSTPLPEPSAAEFSGTGPVGRFFILAFDFAFHLTMRLADRAADHWYRIDTRRENRPEAALVAQTRHADPAMNMPSYYLRLLALRRFLRTARSDVVADLGCGTGRALAVFAAAGVKRCRGVEIDPMLCWQARANMIAFGGGRTPVDIIERDAAAFRFTDETIVYLFNPFGAATLCDVLDNLHASLRDNPRRVRIAYYHPRHPAAFDGREWLKRTTTLRGFKTDIAIYETRA